MKALVTYATRCGSTAEVAEAIAQTLCENGWSADVHNVKEVKDLSAYQAVIIGSAARMNKLMPEAIKFARKHGEALQRVPTAYFAVCIAMKTDTPEHREQASAYLNPLREVKTPVAEGLFGGKVDPETMEPLLRLMMRHVKEGEMAPCDARDWQAIHTWAQELAIGLRV